MSGERFGEFVRREREAKDIGLREMAKMIGVSPTDPSKVERRRVPASGRGQSSSHRQHYQVRRRRALALAGRVSSDVAEIIKRQPAELAALLRTANGMSAEQIARLTRQAQKVKDN